MTTIYRVKASERLHHSDPLHVGRFYPHQERSHRRLMENRQDLILYLANIHAAAVKSGNPLGFCRIPMRLMTLRDWVYDYRTVFDHFFEVVETGYNLGEKHEVSTVIPKKLDEPIETRKLTYAPPPTPSIETVSSGVKILTENREGILQRLATTGRLDLHAPVTWLLDREEVDFLFARSGKLQLRDTSVWPIKGIETWPAWLREDLFGPGIDIESAYTQFLIEHVREAYADRPHMLKMIYPDLFRSLEDKRTWRREICNDVLGLEYTDANIALVKRICMSLANGSRISPSIMLNGISITKDIIIREVTDISPTNLISIGKRLNIISQQFLNARKVVCTLEMGLRPTRQNQKKVFSNYFQWEREARYKIWEAIGRKGIMVHDGIDGVPAEFLADIPGLIKSLNIRLT